MDLVEFLTARLDEDYEVAYGAAPSPWRKGSWDGDFDGPREVLDRHGDVTARVYYGGTYGHILRFDPTRVLRDIEAKRQIVELHTGREDADWQRYMPEFDPSCGGAYGDDEYISDCRTLRTLASVYADHPDFRQEWRP